MSIQKPDLSPEFCSQIMIHGLTTLGKDDLDKLSDLALKGKKGKGESTVAFTDYTIKRQKYFSVIGFSPAKKTSSGKISVDFFISIEPRRFKIPPGVRKELDGFKVMDNLVKMGTKVELHIGANFAYPTERFESVISLPYDMEIPPFEKVEVAGLRINVKRPPDEDYSHIVDLVRKKTISHGISFGKNPSALNASFITDLLAEASKYSRRLIKEREKSGT
jgi:hypothetical protein